MHHILNAAIILGGHLHHLVQEVISGVTKRWSEVTNPPGVTCLLVAERILFQSSP